jgi:GAF domain-containing protein
MPITIRGETIGVLGVEASSSDYQWTEEDRALIEAVGEQLAQALESARLFADTQRRAERERLVGEITAKIRASTDVREILETTAMELGQALGTSRALVRLGSEEPASQPMDDELETGEESE